MLDNKFVLGICGASGSGKTTMANKLQTIYPNDTTVISQDSYYYDSREWNDRYNKKINYDHPLSIEFKLLTDDIQRLKKGMKIYRPNYCYKSHSRTPLTTPVKPCNLLIIEGSLILTNEKLRNEIDISLFLDVDLDICLSRRIKRDTQQRGRTLTSIIQQYEEYVRPMAEKFMPLQREQADIIVNSENSVDSTITSLNNTIY